VNDHWSLAAKGVKPCIGGDGEFKISIIDSEPVLAG